MQDEGSLLCVLQLRPVQTGDAGTVFITHRMERFEINSNTCNSIT